MPYDIQAVAPPQINPSLFQTQPGWAKSSRQTKRQQAHDQLQGILGAGTDYANYLTATETDRYNKSNKILADGAAAFDKPSLTDQDINRMYSGASDRANRDFSANLASQRAAMGQAGTSGGGFSQGAVARYSAARAASLTDARRSLYEKRIETDMADRAARWSAQQSLAAGVSRDPSIVGLDWLGQAGSMALGEQGLEAQRSAAKDAANAAKSAGWMNLAGSLAGAAITAI